MRPFVVTNPTAWKVKVANMLVVLIIWCKIQEENYCKLQTTINLRKWIQLKVYSQKCMDKFVDPNFDILMNWASRMRSHRKVYQNFIFNFEDIWKRKFVFYQALLLSSTLATCFIPSVETLYSGEADTLYVPNFMRSWVIVQIE